MNGTIKNVSIKIFLTIPAIFVGILSAIIFILKPAIDLWSKPKPIQEIVPQDSLENHTFM